MLNGTFSYASFSRRDDRTGGWGVGQRTGVVDENLANNLRKWIPSSIVGGENPGNYPSAEVIARLPRRFAWLPRAEQNVGPQPGFVFYASAQAGQDSTGRPGNVFTFAQVCSDVSMGDYHPAEFMYSPEIPTPFGKTQVDNAEIPAELTVPGPIDQKMVDAFADGWVGDNPLGIHFVQVEPKYRREFVQCIAATISVSRRCVVLACPLPEAALWVAAVACELGLPDDFSFSTYETPERIQSIIHVGCKLSIVPLESAAAVAPVVAHTGALLVRTDQPIPDELYRYREAMSQPASLPQTTHLQHFTAAHAENLANPFFAEDEATAAALPPTDSHQLPPTPIPGTLTQSNAWVKPLQPGELPAPELSQARELYGRLRQTPGPESFAQMLRAHELLSSTANLPIRAGFLALVLLHGMPPQFHGADNLAALADTKREEVLDQAVRLFGELAADPAESGAVAHALNETSPLPPHPGIAALLGDLRQRLRAEKPASPTIDAVRQRFINQQSQTIPPMN
ncbi:MAG: hypothetical protein Q4D85_01755 [Corynebacterium sp.]|uniref:GAP1-N2 domain-containing protein n=1 Tax=Corynebacterium sp. TaxID=1720 RepID=UPI0026DC8489|nr:hypothetical protein [Corynebacterium sp.]MDO5097454.1 hypothetical protein [Corynebacterium sp.]